MRVKSSLSSIAIEELQESSEYYEEQQTGLGKRFLLEIYDSIQSIESNPEAYPKTRGFYREKIVDDFPFVIVYRYSKIKNTLNVLSIFHTSRNPKYKYRNAK